MELVKSTRTAADKENILKENGIRAISVSSSLNQTFSAICNLSSELLKIPV
jgi:hypothetical protein